MATFEDEIWIGPATPADIDGITALFLEDMRDLGEQPDPTELRATAAAMVERNGNDVLISVARTVADRVVGVVAANVFLSIKFPGLALWIEELYVAPAMRRRGLAKRLVTELLARAEGAGIRGVELEAYHMNTAAAVLYRSLGFRRLARERYSFDMKDWDGEDA
jgi:ribosomal protein S18 acetylase RimI-like enzyme